MRIIGGLHKGFVFPGHQLKHTRPTTDRAKESVMNILHHQLDWSQLRVVDLYSGTGNLGFECLSRGAREVHMVEFHPQNIRYIRSVADALGAEVQIHRMRVMDFLKNVNQPFDLVLADPPYGSPEFDMLVDQVMREQVLSPGGQLVLEHPRQRSFDHPMLRDRRDYGQSSFSFFTFE